ncbi:MAG: DUF6429 family protein [Steroidobacteraceae bacterium]
MARNHGPACRESMAFLARNTHFDWEIMGRLHEKGYISDPVGKAKSVLFTEQGLRESERLFGALFCRSGG